MVFFFFFKQKTSYEMRISDWSSDVCSSDLPGGGKERPMTIRTFLVDDHALVRTGIRMILSGAVDIDIIGEAESGEQALPQIRELKPDVVVCDMHLPGISWLEVTERRSEEHTHELQLLMRISDTVLCLNKKKR